MFVQNDENQNEIVTELLEDIITEVISSNKKKPSVPGVILETIMDIVNGVVDVEAPVASTQSVSTPAVSDDVLTSVASSIVAEIVDEVILSNHRQPSIPGVVLQLIMEMITNSDSNNNQQTRRPAATTAASTQETTQPMQTAGDEKVNKLEPSEAQKLKDANAVRAEPMRKVCNFNPLWAH